MQGVAVSTADQAGGQWAIGLLPLVADSRNSTRETRYGVQIELEMLIYQNVNCAFSSDFALSRTTRANFCTLPERQQIGGAGEPPVSRVAGVFTDPEGR